MKEIVKIRAEMNGVLQTNNRVKETKRQFVGGNKSKTDQPLQSWLKNSTGHNVSTSETNEGRWKRSADSPNTSEAEAGGSGVQGQLLLLEKNKPK